MQLDYLSYCVLFHGSETIFSVSKTRGDKFGKKINDYWIANMSHKSTLI